MVSLPVDILLINDKFILMQSEEKVTFHLDPVSILLGGYLLPKFSATGKILSGLSNSNCMKH